MAKKSDKAEESPFLTGAGEAQEPKGVLAPEKSKGGRPTDYNLDVASTICERLSDGESLKAICSEEAMPAKATVFKWLGVHPEFVDMYTRAREEQAETLAAEIVSIADEADTVVKDLGDGLTAVVFDSTAVARNRLRVDARKWVAAKLKPRVYGDKIQHADADGGKLEPATFIVQPVMPLPPKDD